MTTARAERDGPAGPGEPEEFGRLTPEGIQKFREKVGLDWPYTRWTTWNEEATRDGIRHYAYGFGDDNPLWADPEAAPPAGGQGPGQGRAGRGAHVLGRRPHPLLQPGPRGRPALGAAVLRGRQGEGALPLRWPVGGDGAPAGLLERPGRADRDLGRRLRAHRAGHRRQAQPDPAGRTGPAHLHRGRIAGGGPALRAGVDPRRRGALHRGRRGG